MQRQEVHRINGSATGWTDTRHGASHVKRPFSPTVPVGCKVQSACPCWALPSRPSTQVSKRLRGGESDIVMVAGGGGPERGCAGACASSLEACVATSGATEPTFLVGTQPLGPFGRAQDGRPRVERLGPRRHHL